MRPRLILLCGLPGAGKTTLARQLAETVPAVRLCPDEWMLRLGVDLFDEAFRQRLEERFWQLAQELLRLGQSVILESGFWLRTDRDSKRLGARALGVRVELYYLDVPLDELNERLAVRLREAPATTMPITAELLDEYAGYFEPPDPDELALFDPARVLCGLSTVEVFDGPDRPGSQSGVRHSTDTVSGRTAGAWLGSWGH